MKRIALLLTLIFSTLSLCIVAQPTDSTAIWKEEAMRLSKIDRNASNIVYEKWRRWAQENDNIEDEIFATRKIGINYLMLKEYDLSEKYFLLVEPLAKEIGDYKELGIIYNNLALNFEKNNNPSVSNEYYQKAIGSTLAINDSVTYASALTNYSIFLKNQGIYDQALNKSLDAIKILEKSENKKILASAYELVGNIYLKNGNYDHSVRFHKLSRNLRSEIEHKTGLASSLNNIGICYERKLLYDSAFHFYQESLRIKRFINDSISIASGFNNLSHLSIKKSNFIDAIQYCDSALLYEGHNRIVKQKAITLNNLGLAHLHSNHFAKSYKSLNHGYLVCEELNNKFLLQENLEYKIKLHRKAPKLFQNISEIYDQYIDISNELFNSTKDKSITEMRIRYDVDKQKQQNALLTQETKRQQAELEAEHLKNLFLVFGTLALLIISIILYIVFRQRNKHNYLLQELLVEQQHRVKNFLNTIASIFRMHERRATDNAVKEAVKEGSDRLNAMLLIHKQLDQPSVDAPANLNFTDYTLKLVDQLKAAYSGSDTIIQTEMDLDQDINLDVNKAVSLGLILNEVVTNAFKYAVPVTENPSVVISLKKLSQNIILSVQDNGPGIKDEHKNGRNKSLGQKLIQLFTKNLNATYEMRNNNGTLVEITFTP